MKPVIYPAWKRYFISTSETFLVTFASTFFIMLTTAMQNGTVDKAVLISIGMASLVSAVKVVAKSAREYLTNNS